MINGATVMAIPIKIFFVRIPASFNVIHNFYMLFNVVYLVFTLCILRLNTSSQSIKG